MMNMRHKIEAILKGECPNCGYKNKLTEEEEILIKRAKEFRNNKIRD